MLDILLSSESFYKEYQNLKMFIVSPKLSEHLEQMVLKKYSDDMKIKYFENVSKHYATSSKSKGKVSNDQKHSRLSDDKYCSHTIT